MAILTFIQSHDIASMRSRHEYCGFKVVARLLVFLVRIDFAVL
jgi:thiosulfate reductase cytochrome b subunit